VSKFKDIFKSILGICETAPLGDTLWRLEKNTVRIAVDRVADLQKPDGAVYLKGKGLKYPILVVKTADGNYLAFKNRCTHVGHRKLDPVPGQAALRCCSVNHSMYDYKGKRLSGPAKKDLDTYRVSLENGELVLTL